MTDGLKDAHRAAIISVLAANKRVERAVLFGSRATETFTQGSDVDIALFGETLTIADLPPLTSAIDDLTVPQRIDLLLYDRIDSETLREHIQCDGVEWYRRQEDASSVQFHLMREHYRTLEALLLKYLPGIEVWAYGSRGDGRSHDGSDLDLVLRGPDLERLPDDRMADFAEAVRESSIPFLVEVRDWARLPERFHRKIEHDRVVITKGTKSNPEIGNWLYHPQFPACWEHKPLYSMAHWVNGLAFRNIPFSQTGKPVIKIAEIKGGISSQTKFTRHVFDDSVRVRDGDLLFSWSGQPESSIDAYWWRGQEGWLNQHVFRVTSNNGVDLQFFYYLLRYLNPNFVGIARNKQTTGLGHVTKRDLKSIVAAQPHLSEQQAIAHVLGTLDDKIELNRRMNETLEALTRALFKSWFINFDPVRAKMEGRDSGLPKPLAELFPDRLVDSEIGAIPEGWELSQIGKEVDVSGGATPSTKELVYWKEGQHFWATPKDLSKLSSPVLLGTERKITDAGVEKISSGLLPIGTVLLSSRAPIGYLAITDVPTAVNQGFIAMVCKKRLTNLFVLYWCYENLDHIRGIAGGSTFSEISKKVFRPILVAAPSRKVLKAYESLARPLHNGVVANTKENSSLTQIRDVLLPKLISGEIRLRDAERIVETAI